MIEEQRPLPPGWRMVPLPVDKIEKHEQSARDMAALVGAIPRIKSKAPDTWNGKPVQNLTAEEREAFYFSRQPESTQKAMLAQKTRKASEDNDWLLRPMPDCVANPNAKSHDEFTGKRFIDYEDPAMEVHFTKPSRNSLGQSTKSSLSEERRTAGIEAFTYSKPAEVSDADIKRIQKLKGLEAVVAEAPRPADAPKQSWWRRLFKRRKDVPTKGKELVGSKGDGFGITYFHKDKEE